MSEQPSKEIDLIDRVEGAIEYQKMKGDLAACLDFEDVVELLCLATRSPAPAEQIAIDATLVIEGLFANEHSGGEVQRRARIQCAVLEAIRRASAAPAEIEQLRESRNKLIRIEVQLHKDLRKAQLALCPKFVECGDSQGDGCTCFPPDGPFGNAIPPNTFAAPADRAEIVEECAKIADKYGVKVAPPNDGATPPSGLWRLARDIAFDIRALASEARQKEKGE